MTKPRHYDCERLCQAITRRRSAAEVRAIDGQDVEVAVFRWRARTGAHLQLPRSDGLDLLPDTWSASGSERVPCRRGQSLRRRACGAS